MLNPLFPLCRGNNHFLGFGRKFDATRAVEKESLSLSGNRVVPDLLTECPKINVATLRDSLTKPDYAMLDLSIFAFENVATYVHRPFAIGNGGIGRDLPAPKAGDGYENFEGRSGRI